MLTLTRRELLAAAIALTIAPSGTRRAHAAAPNKIPYRILGKTREKVSLVGIGGAHIGKMENEKESIRIIRTAIDNGINFMDNSWDYHEGKSEIRMGKALLDGYREKVFLMTKIDGRNKESAAKQINECLQRLQTDRIDLMQFHEIIRPTDAERIFAEGGALEAVLDARRAGKVRYIGFTGHKSPEYHLQMLDSAAKQNFTFDTVQMPLNVMDAHFESFEKKVLPRLVKEKIGVLGMKSMGDAIILDSKAVTARDCLHYTMSLPVSTVVIGCDSIDILNQAIDLAQDFQPFSEGEVIKLLETTEVLARNGSYELYKTSEKFDATSRNPHWLG